MSEPRDVRQKDLFRPALEDIVDPGHPLVRLAAEIDWDFLDGRFRSVCTPGPGQPPLPTRLGGGAFDPQADARRCRTRSLCARWVENPYYQLLLRRGELPARGCPSSVPP